MKYKYKNLKHVILHGMKPFETKVFDHEILGGGIELVEKVVEAKVSDKKNKVTKDDLEKEL